MEDVKRGEGNDVAWIVFFLFKIMIMSDFRRNILGRQISTLDSFLFCWRASKVVCFCWIDVSRFHQSARSRGKSLLLRCQRWAQHQWNGKGLHHRSGFWSCLQGLRCPAMPFGEALENLMQLKVSRPFLECERQRSLPSKWKTEGWLPSHAAANVISGSSWMFCEYFFPCFFASQTVSGGVSVRSLEWSTSEFGDFLEELGDLSWSPPQECHVWLFGPVGVVDSLTEETPRLWRSHSQRRAAWRQGPDMASKRRRREFPARQGRSKRLTRFPGMCWWTFYVEITPWKSYLKAVAWVSWTKFFDPCGKVHHSVAQDSSIEMGCNDFTSSLSMYWYIFIYVLYMSCFFWCSDRTLEARHERHEDLEREP